MKRILLFVLLGHFSLYAQEIKIAKSSVKEIRNVDDAHRMIVSVFNPLFLARDNILTSRMTVEQSKAIYDFLTEVQKFINTKDKSFLPAYNTTLNITNDIMNTLKLIYNSQIVPALKNEKYKETGLPKFDRNELNYNKLSISTIEQYILSLDKDQALLFQLEDELNYKKVTTSAAKDVQSILKYIVIVLQDTINKINKDFGKF